MSQAKLISPSLFPWDNELSLVLIEEFRKQEVLWDPKHALYFNVAMKEKAWVDIGRIMRASSYECKRKMDSLKGSFRRERSRTKKIQERDGKGSFKPKWFAYEAMKFMDGRDDPRAAKRAALEKDPLAEAVAQPEEMYTDMQWDPELKTEITYDDENFMVENSPEALEEPIEEEERAEIRKDDLSDFAEAQVLLHVQEPASAPATRFEEAGANEGATTNANCTCRDECSTYGEHVAHKLRKLDQRSRSLVQHKINNLLFKAEMRTFGYGSSP